MLDNNHPKYGGVKWIQEGHGNDKLCPIDRHVKMVSPCGDVVDVPIATGSNIPRNRNMAYESHIVESKLRKGWKMYDEKNIEKTISDRQQAKFDRGNRMNESFKTAAERMQEASAKNVDRLIEAMTDSLAKEPKVG